MSLTAYFDASGKEDQGFLVVAGFISSSTDWLAFDRFWKERLAADGLEYFRASEFAHSKGQFSDGWEGESERRKALSADLMDILKRHVYRRFSDVVISEALAGMSSATKAEYLINAYSLAGRTCAARLRQWLQSEQWETIPTLIFEDGDIGKGRLRDCLLRDGFSEPRFITKVDRSNVSQLQEILITPLQAADWLAYETFLASKRREMQRWAMLEFERIPGSGGIYLADDVARLEERLNAPADVGPAQS